MTDEITKQQVIEAWQASIGAATIYEDHSSPENFQAMIDRGNEAEQLQATYDAQYEEWVTS